MIPALSQVCSLPSEFAENIEAYAEAGCHTMEIWLTKLEQYLGDHSVADVRQLFDRHGVSAPVASFQGGLFQPPNAGLDEAWNTFERRLALCRDVGIKTLVVAGDVRGEISQQLVDHVVAQLGNIAESADQYAMEVAFEFQGHASFPNNLQTAVSLVSSVGKSSLGLCFDAFHFYVGSSKFHDLHRLGADNLFHVQLCDLVDVSRELATDSQRILPGDEAGNIVVAPIIDRLRKLDYARAVSVELMDARLWQIPPRQFAETALAAIQRSW